MLKTKSPCRNAEGKQRCSTNLGGDVCESCGRTVFEIAHWGTYSDEQKHLINERVAITHRDGELNSNE